MYGEFQVERRVWHSIDKTCCDSGVHFGTGDTTKPVPFVFRGNEHLNAQMVTNKWRESGGKQGKVDKREESMRTEMKIIP